MSTAYAAECQLYETGNYHINYPLNGSHLQAGKCSTCASCHVNGKFLGTPKVCDQCHGSSGLLAPVYKSTSHFPITGTLCSDCHNTISFTTSVNMNHIVLGSFACVTCHTSLYVNYGAQVVTSQHIPIGTIACNLCHTSTTSFSIITSVVSIHTTLGTTALIATSITSCNMCHSGLYVSENAMKMHECTTATCTPQIMCISCHATGASPRARQTMSLNHRGGTSIKTDCSQSGCHRPAGNTGSLYSSWD